ncbi:hypothetical protein MNBD_ALPHA09-1789 [hydrothermal vent metagenome]|uniref:Uncharacterized protein n=1 Tax=hydrothermal vent metagenome TaxID=652676 RepID=A0A3B0TA87_9ZZZZ
MGLRDAAASVPAKPIIAVVLGVTFLAAGWNGWTVYSFCTQRGALSSSLQVWADKAIAGFGTEFKLETATDFEWDQVRISQKVANPGTGQNCPFGLHWNNEKRAQMARAGELTLFGFLNKDRLVEIVDFDRAWADFETDGEAISREEARFVNVPGTLTLRRANPSPGQ